MKCKMLSDSIKLIILIPLLVHQLEIYDGINFNFLAAIAQEVDVDKYKTVLINIVDLVKTCVL